MENASTRPRIYLVFRGTRSQERVTHNRGLLPQPTRYSFAFIVPSSISHRGNRLVSTAHVVAMTRTTADD